MRKKRVKWLKNKFVEGSGRSPYGAEFDNEGRKQNRYNEFRGLKKTFKRQKRV